MSFRPVLLLLVLLATVFPATPAEAQGCTLSAILWSGGTATGHCSIQDAIDAAAPHDSVLVLDPAVAHLEAPVIPATLHNLTLCAANAAANGCGTDTRPTIDGSGSSIALTIQARDVTVSSLSFRGSQMLVRASGADRLDFRHNTLDVQVSGIQAQHGIDVRNAASPVIRDNEIVGNIYPGSISIALRTVTEAQVLRNDITRSGTSIYTAASTGVIVSGNTLTVPSVSQFASESLGISFFRGGAHLVHHNTVEGAGVALTLKGAVDVTAHNETYRTTVTGVRLSAALSTQQPHGLVLRDMDLAGTETALLFPSGFDEPHGLTVDARCVDWGAYTRSTIDARIVDAVGTNTVRFQPWLVPDASGMVCLVPPDAAISIPAGPHTRLAAVAFTDATTAGSRSILERLWDFGDGNTSNTQHPAHRYEDVGTYTVSLVVTDDVGQTDRAEATVVVQNILPTFQTIADRTVGEGTPIAIRAVVTDAEGDPLTLSLSPIPSGMAFTDHGNGTADIAWTPTHAQSGTYAFTLTADDTLDTNTTSFSIVVNDVNGVPVLAAIGAKSVNEDQTLAFDVSASDPDGEALALAAFVLPPGAGFVDNGDGTGRFTWRPTYFQSGVYDLTFQATDGVRVDREDIQITVLNTNRPPTLAAISDRTVQTGTLLSFFVSGQDPDGEALVYTASNLPPGASFDATRRLFTWTPTLQHVGSWSGITFTVSDGSAFATRTMTITVQSDQTYGVAMEPTTDTAVFAAAGETVHFDVKVANVGTTTRTYTLTVQPVPIGWNLLLNRTSVTLDPGQTVAVRLSVTPNDDHARRELYINATDSLTSASLKVAVAVPVKLHVVMTRVSLTDEVFGQVTARYHDGSPARNHQVTVIERPRDTNIGIVTMVSGDTNDLGVYSFRLPYDPLGSNRLGNHRVEAQYATLGGLSRGFTEYFIGSSIV